MGASATGAKYSSVTVTALTSGACTTKVNDPSVRCHGRLVQHGRAGGANQSAGLYMPLARSRGFVVPRCTNEGSQVPVPMLRAVKDDVPVSPDSSVRYGLWLMY